MQHDQFIGEVQHHAHLGSRGAAENAVRATLETLAERLAGGAAENLAAQLPPEIGRYLRGKDGGERLSLDEFFERVSERSDTDKPKAVFHCRAVLEVLKDAVAPGTMEKIRAQLPDEYDPLFEAGSEGGMRLDGREEEEGRLISRPNPDRLH